MARILPAVVAFALALGGLFVAATPVNAGPGQPGRPQPGVVVFADDFENSPAPEPIRVTDYVGAAPVSQTYTADPAYLANCNGWLLSRGGGSDGFAPGLADCGNPAAWENDRWLAYGLGVYHGEDEAGRQANHAISAYTTVAPGTGKIELEAMKPIPVAPNRFLTLKLDIYAMNCEGYVNPSDPYDPRLQAYLLNGNVALPAYRRDIDPCTDGEPTKPVEANGTFLGDLPVLFPGTQVRFRLTNPVGSSPDGNDHSIDEIEVIDVSPQVDKAFSTPSNSTSMLTFTITNTDDLLPKPGWSFTDRLPAGMTVAGPARTATTCTNGNITAAPGATQIHLAGDLGAGQASCTLSVAVTAATGAYRNCADNIIAPVGINAPGCAMVEFAAELAYTGIPLGTIAATGMALTALGALAVWTTRIRRRA